MLSAEEVFTLWDADGDGALQLTEVRLERGREGGERETDNDVYVCE